MKKDIAIFLFIIFMASGFAGLGGDKLISYISPSYSNHNVIATPSPAQPPPVSSPTPTGPSPTLSAPTPTTNPSATITPTTNPPSPTPTITATPTVTPTPLTCPRPSGRTFVSLNEMIEPYSGILPIDQNPDYNIGLRGYQLTTGDPRLQNINGPTPALKPPQLNTLFRGHGAPVITHLYKVNKIGGTSAGIETSADVTLMGIATIPGESLYPPFSEYNIGDNVPPGTPIPYPYQVYVLYAEANRIVLKYDRNDTPAKGFMLHIENICVNQDLLNYYNLKSYNDLQKRQNPNEDLIALKEDDPFGTARTDHVLVSIRANGSFMDPRSRKDWWQGY